MPCDSSYMYPNHFEKELSKVCAILDEIKTFSLDKHDYEGYHPKVYCMSRSKEWADKKVASLCKKMRKIEALNNVRSMSLEAQIWWRDHKEWDQCQGR